MVGCPGRLPVVMVCSTLCSAGFSVSDGTQGLLFSVSGIVAVPQSLLFPERPSVQFSSRGGQEPAHEGSFALGDQKIHQVLGRFV